MTSRLACVAWSAFVSPFVRFVSSWLHFPRTPTAQSAAGSLPLCFAPSGRKAAES